MKYSNVEVRELSGHITEAELQRTVIEMAQALGWRVAHFRPALTSRGWRTPVEADGKGFPDLVLCRKPRVVFVELKRDGAMPTADQRLWLNAFYGGPGVETYVWRPRDMDEIKRLLALKVVEVTA